MNTTQLMAMTPYEIIKYKREQLDLMASKQKEYDNLVTMGHDCKGNEDDACVGCARLESIDDEITFIDLQIDLANKVLESNEYAMQPHVKEVDDMIAHENSSEVKHS